MLNILIGLYVISTSLGLIVLKIGTNGAAPILLESGRPTLNINPLVIFGIALYATSFLLYIYLISKFDLGYIIPLTTALVYLIIFIASFVIFDEIFTFVKILGIILILTGVILLNIKK